MPNSMTLALMVGEVMTRRKGITRPEVTQDINAAIRLAMGMRPFWADLLTRGIISIPDTYKTGTVSVSPGSNAVTGAGTNWPVSDAVNTSLASKVNASGDYVECAPGSMNGIRVGSLLYFGGSLAEAAAVVEVTRSTFWCRLNNPHDAGDPVTASALAGRQFRVSTGTPIFTVRAVVSATQLLLDIPWGGGSLAGKQYNVYQAYYPIDPDFKEFIAVKDDLNGWPIKFNVPVQLADARDAQRAGTGDPMWLIDHSPNEGGVMQVEIFPHQYAARQISVLYAKGWPDLKRDNDRPPFFIDPTVWIAAAKAKALMTRKPVMVPGAMKLQDPYYDPAAAQMYMNEAQMALQAAINADESKAVRALDANWNALAMPGSASDFWMARDPQLMAGAF